MPDTLVIDPDGVNLIVPVQRAGKTAKRLVGDISTASAGNQRTHIIAELDNIPVVLLDSTPAICRQIESIFARGAQVVTAGTVWNRDDAGATHVLAWGEYTDDMQQGGPRRVPGINLHEVGDALGYVAPSAVIYLGSQDSPDDPGDSSILLASADAADDPFSAGLGGLTLMIGVTIPTCGGAPDPSVNCAIAFSGLEKSWLMPAAVADGWLAGTLQTVFLSNGGAADRWQTQAYRAEIFVVRGGVDVVEWDTGWSDTNAAPFGGNSTATGPQIIYQILTGDRVRIDLYSRAGLHGGYTDDGVHQALTFGNGGAGNHYGRLLIGGEVAKIWGLP